MIVYMNINDMENWKSCILLIYSMEASEYDK